MTDDEHLADDLAGDTLGMAMPFGNPIGKQVMKPLRREWGRNTSRALKAAEAASGLSREDFAEWLDRDSRGVPLYLTVLWAAGMNGHDQTLRAMGAVLGQAAKASARDDDSAIERAELALRAMADLGPSHFRVLAVLGDAQVIITGDEQQVYSEFMSAYVAERVAMDISLTTQCLLNLANAGLAQLLSVWDGNAYPITDLGRAVLSASREVTGG